MQLAQHGLIDGGMEPSRFVLSDTVLADTVASGSAGGVHTIEALDR